MKILIDAMGGDNAPKCVIEGALQAISQEDDFNIILVGKQEVLSEMLSKYSYDSERIEILPASEVVEMCDTPTDAIRKKTDSSMVVGLNALVEGKGDIFISAGNTGALVAGSTLLVKRMPGIKRPPIATQLPTRTGSVLLLDAGANADCKPAYLEQFALMGSIYMNKVVGVENPRVGLVNNGAEEEKGSLLTKEAYQHLKALPINFVGNAEGRELIGGDFDVIVTDGFTGNIILKFLEGTASLIISELKKAIMGSAKSKFGGLFIKDSLRAFKKKFDYTEYGGALLLGLKKGVIKAHGSSDAKAISSAVLVARKFVLSQVVEEIQTEIAKLRDRA